MGLRFTPTLASEQSALMEFLSGVFHADPQLNSFQSQVLQWKYFSSHPEWSPPRSFSLKKEEEIVAHGGIWPMRLRVEGADIQAINLIDWAANAASLGAGVHVLRSIATMCDLMVTIGGSPDTRKILPKLGYQGGGSLRRYVRVVRPWLQLRTRPHLDWKTPARFVRNASALFKSLPEIPETWRVEKVARFGAEIEPLLRPGYSSRQVCADRTVANLNHMLVCPAAEFSAFIISEAGRPVGYFVLSKVGRQARIVDLVVDSVDPKLWVSACATATLTARQDPEIVEIVGGTSSGEVGRIFEELGFRLCRADEILYYDPRNRLAAHTRLGFNLIDVDFSFMYDPNHPYIS